MSPQPAMRRPITRRDVLKAGAAFGVAAASGILVACAPSSTSGTASPARSVAPTAPGGSAAPSSLEASLTIWTQDYPPLSALIERVTAAVHGAHPGVQFDVQTLAYDELNARFLPAIAAQNEADIMLVDFQWIVGSDISRLFLPFVGDVITRAEAEELFYPTALDIVSVGESAYVAPTGNGGGGSVWTYNAAILEEEGIDPDTITTWDEFVRVGKELTRRDGDDIVRSGIALSDGNLDTPLAWISGILQLGGSPFDEESGRWNLTSDESIQAFRNLDDLVKVHKVDSFAVMNGAPEAFEKGLSVFSNVGSWMVAGFAETTPDFRAGILPTPSMGTSDALAVPGGGVGGYVMSRRLADDAMKREAARLFVENLTAPDTAAAYLDEASIALAMRAVASDPEVQASRRYGQLQKMYDELMWPRLVPIRHHIPNWHWQVAYPALERVWLHDEPVANVMKELEDQSNDLEAKARERLGLS